MNERFSVAEERANTVSATVGVFLSFLALSIMVMDTWQSSWQQLFSAVLFGCSLLLLYTSSALNHGLPHGPAKDFCHNLDQAAIYALIAGSYTPIMLVGLNNRTGFILAAAEWTLAGLGIGRALLKPDTFAVGIDRITLISYLVMGWLLMLAPFQVYEALSGEAIIWIGAGGVFYTGGVAFFLMHSLKFHHLIWHICVISGSICHFIAIWKYLL